MDEFATAFTDADSLFILDIYAANEQPIEGITGKALAERIRQSGNSAAEYVSSFSNAVEAVTATATEGDLVLTLGAGNVHQVGPMILDRVAELAPSAVRTGRS
jgi:UDP-N-acetylmuramate--alanine ligase